MGRYLVVGFAGGEITAIAANCLLLEERTAIGVLWGRARDSGLETTLFLELQDYLAAGTLKNPPVTAYPFGAAAAAVTDLAARAVVGKAIIYVDAE